MDGLLAQLTFLLGYDGDPGWVQQAASTQLDVAYRSPVQQAFGAWGVVGVFAIEHGGTSASMVPVVYVATATDDDNALEVHRAIWTQGVVPFLLIVTPDGAWSCDGFAPPSADLSRRFIEASRLTSSSVSSSASEIAHLTSLALRVSLSRPGRPASNGRRVDERLLSNLRGLVRDITGTDTAGASLPAAAANALIGRLLFMRFLRDRGTMPADWMPASRAPGTDRSAWLEGFWKCLEDADRVFNGSVFPIREQQRCQIRPEHADWAFEVVINDAKIVDGQLQLSFAEFRFAALRTETLSAVYELFLELSNPEKKGEDGAIYTPPHLADHVLQKVAAMRPMKRGDTVFDCAMGSGVFLVGAFRRLAEDALTAGMRTLPLKDLHELARQSIWGVEKNGDACQVAALSLYLTMLDYADASEVGAIIGKRARSRRVFPEMVGRNLLERDFFDDGHLPSAFPTRFTHIIANPPWTKLTAVGLLAQEYVAGAADAFTDHERAAPAFMHKALAQRLKPEGVFGFVMSARAIISSAARNFPTYLTQRTGLSGCSNLSSLRRTLFLGAEHAALVLVGHADRAHAGNTLNVFMPNQTTQPMARDGRHWVIVEDRAECRSFRRDLLRSPNDLVDALMLPTADLRFREWVKATHRAKGLWTLGDALDALDLSFTRGGTDYQTGVPTEYILTATKNSPNYYLNALDGGGLFDRSRHVLPAEIIASVKPRYQQMFAGNIVVFARGTGRTRFVDRPIAFNSSFYGIYANSPSDEALEFLYWLSDYLNTGFARYCMSVTGRDWAIDHRRLEKEQLLLIPLHPATGGPVPGLAGRIGASRTARIPSFVGPVWKEYDEYRHKLQNGTRPAEANASADAKHRGAYELALGGELDRYLGSSQPLRVRSHVDSDNGLGVVVAATSTARDGSPLSKAGQTSERDFSDALAAFEKSRSNLVRDSSWLSRTDDGTIAIVKPLGRSYWTIERAFEDAAMVVADALSSNRSGTR